MKQMTVTALKQHLKERPSKDLINDIADLFSKFDYVKEYYGVRLDSDVAEAVFQKYKQIIKDEFLPERGFGTLRASVAKKALSDYKKIRNDPYKIADLTLFYAETAAEFVCTYGDIPEPFYGSMVEMYGRTLKHIFEHGLQEEFRERCIKLIRLAGNFGFGVREETIMIYKAYYGQDSLGFDH